MALFDLGFDLRLDGVVLGDFRLPFVLGGLQGEQHVAREGGGKSGGYRSLVFFRHEERAIFAFGFAKSDKANLSVAELKVYKKAAKIVLALTQAQIDTEVREERLFEVNDDAQDL